MENDQDHVRKHLLYLNVFSLTNVIDTSDLNFQTLFHVLKYYQG